MSKSATLLEALAALEYDGRAQLEELLSNLEDPAMRGAVHRAYRLTVSTQKAALLADAMKATGADANSALQAAARLIAAEITVPPEPALSDADSETDRVVEALESIRDAIGDRG